VISIKKSHPFRVTVPLLVSQTIGAFNDNAMKAILPIMAAVQFGKASMDSINQQVSILLILPFVIFAPFAGWVSDRFSKKKVIKYSLFCQLLGLGILGAALYSQNLEFALAGFFVLSIQSAFFSPAKKGILKELVGTNKLGKAVGYMEMLAMVGILGGAFTGAYTFDQLVADKGGWDAALVVCAYIFVLAFISWVIAFPIPETQAPRAKPFRSGLLVSHFQDLIFLFKQRGLRYAALGDAWFWGMGSFFYLVLVKLSGEVVIGQVGMGTLYGYWFLLLGLGVMMGSLFVAYLNRGRIEIGLTPIGGICIPFIYIGLYFANPQYMPFDLFCFGLGFFGALFFVPLNGYLQDQAEEDQRGRVLAASNLLTQLCGIGLIFIHVFLSNVLELSSKQEILVVFVLSLIVGIVVLRNLLEDFFRAWFHMFLRVFYRIRVEGMNYFPEKGGVLLVSNHLSYGDPVFIGAAFSRKVRYLAYSGLANSRIMKMVFHLTKTVTVSPEKSLDSIKASVEKLKEGLPLCVFAEGGISRMGVVFPFKRGVLLLAKKANVPILPVHVDRVWGSVFSMSGGKFFNKWPIRFPYPITVRAGSLISPNDANTDNVRIQVLELGRQSFNQRLPSLKVARNFIENSVLSDPQLPFIRFSTGCIVNRSEFFELILSEKKLDSTATDEMIQLVFKMTEFFQDVQSATRIWASYSRLREIDLWDQSGFAVDGNSEIQTELILWVAFMGKRKVEYTVSSICITKDWKVENADFQTISGLSTEKTGLVSLNYKSSAELVGSFDELEAGFKENTFGRLLPGLSFISAPVFGVYGTDSLLDPISLVKGIDRDAFLIPA
jgi:acyl-[acyl-carrier-protein]-phospholipid O-acyltransferase/long-chain-fatty-acid--[acyl-carrier-protein] ligase